MGSQLRYQEGASKWLEALPVGNGSFGQMVYGRVQLEQISLNEESFWAGYPRDNHRPEAYEYLGQVRQYINQGEYVKAQTLAEHKMLSRFNQPYQPLGTLNLAFPEAEEITDYERVLDMDRGIVTVKYKTERSKYTREYFCSYPDQVMAVKLSVEGNEKLDFEITMDSPCKYKTELTENGELMMEAAAPSAVIVKDVYQFPEDSEILYENKDTIHGFVMLGIEHNEGESICTGNGIRIRGCHECILYLAATTSFKMKDGKKWCQEQVDSARSQGYEALRARHEEDFSALSTRVNLKLNHDETSEHGCTQECGNDSSNRPASELLQDPEQRDRVTELLFQYGRYLLISSSREGGLPANLQGIWNDKCVPPWWSNWTMNINLEMNYWPAYRCNLAECAKPLHQFIGKMAEKGKKTAMVHYGCRGWTSHHMTDIWMDTTPVGDNGHAERDSASWAMWNLSGAWLCLHLWEAFQYTEDMDFLKNYAYPIMKGSAEFIMDWLVKEDGLYHTLPSISPENIYLTEEGGRCAICRSSAMDMEIIGELLESVEKAGRLSGEEEGFLCKLKERYDNLAPIRIGKNGQILEWGKEWKEEDAGHRHFSHLFGLYPGHQFTAEKNIKLRDGAKISLMNRMANGGGSTGWSRAWAICLWARLGCGQEAYESVKKFQQEDIFQNFLGFCPPKYFQIDCNFGFTAAIAEMLLQTEDGVIIPLPALPDEWECGEIAGLVCERGNTVDIVWAEKKVVCIRIKAAYKGTCIIKSEGMTEVTSGSEKIHCTIKNGKLEFEQEQGKEYKITACNTQI